VKPVFRLIPLILIASIVASCGYYNPYVYSGPEKSIYMTEWKNRTSELSLHSDIYRSLTKWFQKSSSISVVRDKSGADIILAGEIISIDRPSLSYGIGSVTSEVKAKLRVRYIVKEISTNKIILEVADETWTKEYLVGGSASATRDNEDEALEEIIEDISQKIYRNSVAGLPKL